MKKNTPKHFLAILLIGIHLWQASLVRPVADDYTLLKIFSQEGFVSSISYIWNNFGGNITPAVIRAAYLSFSVDASNWYGFMAFSLTTSMLVVASYLVLITWLTNRGIRQITINDLLISLLASLAFDGLFTPGLSSAYLFGAAAGVHLWPICIFILTLKLIDALAAKQSRFRFLEFLLLSMFLGFIVGNSGLAESSAIFLTLLIITIKLQTKRTELFPPKYRMAMNSYLSGVSLGLTTILLAPGFTSRNHRLGKIDEGLVTLLESFRSSLVSFFGDIFTHPIWLFGVLTVVFQIYSFRINLVRAQILLMYFVFTFVMLVLGSTFGYAAWHQSSGLIFLLMPAAFCFSLLSSRVRDRFKSISLVQKTITLTAITLILLGLMVRGMLVQEDRSSTWDSNLLINYCSIIQTTESPLLGAEIKYWPIGLGIEDVNRWAWMERDYRSWLSSLSEGTPWKCSKLE